jgi:hypothetical protein
MTTRQPIAKTFADRTTAELCRLIEDEDMSMLDIANAWGVPKPSLQIWIDSDPARATASRVARENAADFCDREAERILRDLSAKSTMAELGRARELAQHLRWRARVRCPARYSEKIQLAVAHADIPAERLPTAELQAIAARKGLVIDGTCTVAIPANLRGEDHDQG